MGHLGFMIRCSTLTSLIDLSFPPPFTCGVLPRAVGRVDVPTFDHRCDSLPKGGIKMIFWDMGGEDELQCLWEKYVTLRLNSNS